MQEWEATTRVTTTTTTKQQHVKGFKGHNNIMINTNNINNVTVIVNSNIIFMPASFYMDVLWLDTDTKINMHFTVNSVPVKRNSEH